MQHNIGITKVQDTKNGITLYNIVYYIMHVAYSKQETCLKKSYESTLQDSPR